MPFFPSKHKHPQPEDGSAVKYLVVIQDLVADENSDGAVGDYAKYAAWRIFRNDKEEVLDSQMDTWTESELFAVLSDDNFDVRKNPEPLKVTVLKTNGMKPDAKPEHNRKIAEQRIREKFGDEMVDDSNVLYTQKV